LEIWCPCLLAISIRRRLSSWARILKALSTNPWVSEIWNSWSFHMWAIGHHERGHEVEVIFGTCFKLIRDCTGAGIASWTVTSPWSLKTGSCVMVKLDNEENINTWSTIGSHITCGHRTILCWSNLPRIHKKIVVE
jgi:hypothetical protein